MHKKDKAQDCTEENRTHNGVMDILARLPERTLLDEKAMAEAFGVTPRTIRRMVGRHEIPPGVALAGKTVWMAGRALSHIEENLEKAARSAQKRAESFSKNTPCNPPTPMAHMD